MKPALRGIGEKRKDEVGDVRRAEDGGGW